MSHEIETFSLELNKYQLVNLRWLFEAINTMTPFTYLNNGDWAGEIPYIIDHLEIDFDNPPNAGVDWRERIQVLLDTWAERRVMHELPFQQRVI